MKWSKLKNIVLFLLVVTNLCLLVIVGHQTLEEVRSRQQNRIDAIQFLIDRGVEITEEQVPDQIELRAQQVERDLELERQLAARLLGPAAQLEKRGGEVYLWSSGNGYIQFHSDGAFQAELAAGVFPVGEDREESCREAAERFGLPGRAAGGGGGRGSPSDSCGRPRPCSHSR